MEDEKIDLRATREQTSDTRKGYSLIQESENDLIIMKNGKPILKISLPEQSTQWNCNLP